MFLHDHSKIPWQHKNVVIEAVKHFHRCLDNNNDHYLHTILGTDTVVLDHLIRFSVPDTKVINNNIHSAFSPQSC